MATAHRFADARVAGASTTAIFLVMRRMRAPLIALITLFSVSIFGLTLIPGKLEDGTEWHMNFFDAFYVMSYTATTIGYGEIPHPYTDGQRMWVTLSIYLGVITWAYAIGALLALLRDKSFRQALSTQRFMREVRNMSESFYLVAGFGQAGAELCGALDYLGRRVVVIDLDETRIEALDLGSFQFNIPGLVGDARNPGNLEIAGLDSKRCRAIVAFTNDDEVNLAIVMTAALLRPDLPVIARATSPDIEARMRVLGDPLIINPFDSFGEDLTLSITSPATRQLINWLASPPDARLPERLDPPTDGTWVIAGHGRFGHEMAEDLQRQGLQVSVIDLLDVQSDLTSVPDDLRPTEFMRVAHLDTAAGLVAGTDNDVTNLSVLVAAKRAHDDLFIVARQNETSNADLFDVLKPDAILIPTRYVAREALVRIGSPLLWEFLRRAPSQGEDWASEVLHRLSDLNDGHRPDLWDVHISPYDAPAVLRRLAAGPVTLADIMRDPEDRQANLHIVVLSVTRDGVTTLTPAPDFELQPDDHFLLAGMSFARQGLETNLQLDASMTYVMTGQQEGAGWLWRTLFDRHNAA